jgi:hypothetical protein
MDEIVWFGFSGDGRELHFTAAQVYKLYGAIPQHWKAFKYYNGRSLEVGGARIVKTREEAIKRKWYDVAEHFFDEPEQQDESIH